MAFPTIPTVAAGRVLGANQADTSQTRTFPSLTGLTKNAGDLLIAIIVTYQAVGAAATFSGWGASFSEVGEAGAGGSNQMGIGVAYKISTGSETGTFTVTQATTVTGHASMILLSIPGAHASSAPEVGGYAANTTAVADPASFDPSWAAEDILWISIVGCGETNAGGTWTACGSTPPSNFSDWFDTNKADTGTVGECEAAVSFRQVNADSLDVGTASGVDVSNARNSAYVIAVRPLATISLTLTAAEATASAVALTISPGTASPAITPAQTDAQAVALTISSGAVSLTLTPAEATVSAVGLVILLVNEVDLSPAEVTVSAVALTITTGTATLTLTAAEATTTAVALTPTAGGTTVALTPAQTAVEAVLLAAAPGEVSLTLSPAETTVEAVELIIVIDGGPITFNLQPAVITTTAVAVTLTAGAVAVDLTPAVATVSAVALTVLFAIDLTPATVTVSAVALVAAPGAVSLDLTPAEVLVSAVAVTVQVSFDVALDLTPAEITTTAVALILFVQPLAGQVTVSNQPGPHVGITHKPQRVTVGSSTDRVQVGEGR